MLQGGVVVRRESIIINNIFFKSTNPNSSYELVMQYYSANRLAIEEINGSFVGFFFMLKRKGIVFDDFIQ